MAFTDDAERKIDRGVADAKRAARHTAHKVRAGAQDLQRDAAREARSLLDQLDKSLRDNSDVDVAALRKRLQAQLDEARGVFGDAADSAADQVRETVARAADFARERPWQAIGVVAGLAFLVGAVVGRRD
jgi:ElaB protein